MTNREWLTSLSDEELAEILHDIAIGNDRDKICIFCKYYKDGHCMIDNIANDENCRTSIFKWLKAEREE